MVVNGSNGIWKLVATSALSALAAGVTSWLTFGANKIDRTEAIEIVRCQSPYLEDRKLLNSTLQDMSQTIKHQGSAINSISTTQAVQTATMASIAEEQRKLNIRIDQMMRDSMTNHRIP